MSNDDNNIEAAKERVSMEIAALAQRVPFFGHLLLKKAPMFTSAIPMAGVTAGGVLLLNPDWVVKTSRGELTATLVHEVLHLALCCFQRQGKRTAVAVSRRTGAKMSVWNLAHDYVVNQMIADFIEAGGRGSGLLHPTEWEPPGLFNPQFAGMSAEEIYDMLISDMPEMNDPNGDPRGKGEGGESQDGDESGDSEGENDDDGNDGESSGGMKPQSGQGGQEMDADKAGIHVPEGGEDFYDEPQGQQQQDDGDFGGMDPETFWTMALVEAAISHERQKGTLPGSVRKIVKELTDPVVDWQTRLSQFLGENALNADYTWKRPNRRYDDYLPSFHKSGTADLVLLIDTSGSMGGREKQILGEAWAIIEDLELKARVMCCDTRVTFDSEDVDSVEDIEFLGGGGSNFCPAFQKLEDDSFCGVVIAFTDGYIDVPPGQPSDLQSTLWCLWNRRDTAPTTRWGEVLYLEDEKG